MDAVCTAEHAVAWCRLSETIQACQDGLVPHTSQELTGSPVTDDVLPYREGLLTQNSQPGSVREVVALYLHVLYEITSLG